MQQLIPSCRMRNTRTENKDDIARLGLDACNYAILDNVFMINSGLMGF